MVRQLDGELCAGMYHCFTCLLALWGVWSPKDNEVIQVVVNMLHPICLDVLMDWICNGVKYLGGGPQSKGQHFV